MKKEIIKTEQSYKCLGGAICGGVIKKSLFDSDPWAYMMSYIMDDDMFEKYKIAKANGDKKLANKIFNEHAKSMIS